jgi:hypothetical protein
LAQIGGCGTRQRTARGPKAPQVCAVVPQFHPTLPETEPQILLNVFNGKKIFSNSNVIKKISKHLLNFSETQKFEWFTKQFPQNSKPGFLLRFDSYLHH